MKRPRYKIIRMVFIHQSMRLFVLDGALIPTVMQSGIVLLRIFGHSFVVEKLYLKMTK